MNTRQRRAAQQGATGRHAVLMRPSFGVSPMVGMPRMMPNPACVPGSGQRCEHALVDQALNAALFEYESRVTARFDAIIDTLKAISIVQYMPDFVLRAQSLAMDRLGYTLPEPLLTQSWVRGLDVRQLHAHCVLRTFKFCVDQAAVDQADWRLRETINAEFLRDCGFHTVDITPCADGRLQGLLPFVLRIAPGPEIIVKAYAGCQFDIERDMNDWAHREIARLNCSLPAGAHDGNYLKIAVYHYSTAAPNDQGCAAHSNNQEAACGAALDRLNALRTAIDATYGRGAAPDTLLIGLDTDLDAIRVHIPDAEGHIDADRFIDATTIYRATNGADLNTARAALRRSIDENQTGDGMAPGMLALVERLLEANLSQIEYVILHHAGRYAELGHDEHFICAGETPSGVKTRNIYYFAHLDTVEEGAADLDVGVKVFTSLNLAHGLAIPVLVHFTYDSNVPGGRERAVRRCRRVKAAIEGRYATLVAQGQLYCDMAISDRNETERCCFIDHEPGEGAGHITGMGYWS